jgi:hypothetical protein
MLRKKEIATHGGSSVASGALNSRTEEATSSTA